VTIPPATSTVSPGPGPALTAGGQAVSVGGKALSAGGKALSAGGKALSADEFRRAMGRHPAGVAIVTLAGPSGPGGLTVTSFSSASLDPPLVSFYIAHTSSNWPAVLAAEHFAVNLVGEGHQSLAHRFAVKGEDRFAPPTRWRRGPHGLPLLAGATTHLICATASLITVGDHELVVGLVIEAAFGRGDRPLLHHQGRFTRPEVSCRSAHGGSGGAGAAATDRASGKPRPGWQSRPR
jgi:flavin reductase (DIM6/NTAB) family NADH-FMN oxidoreductase RutF